MDSEGEPTGVQRQVVAGGVAQWRHDWGLYFTSSAEAGAVRLYRLDSGRGFWSPIGTAMLAYVEGELIPREMNTFASKIQSLRVTPEDGLRQVQETMQRSLDRENAVYARRNE